MVQVNERLIGLDRRNREIVTMADGSREHPYMGPTGRKLAGVIVTVTSPAYYYAEDGRVHRLSKQPNGTLVDAVVTVKN